MAPRRRKPSKKKPSNITTKQGGKWRTCPFSKCRSPHRELTFRGYCSENCKEQRQISDKKGYQFDLGHPVRSGWERRYALWLKKRKIKYEYEPKQFVLRGNVRYVPDFYIPAHKTYVEVKGIMSERDKLKIKLFRETGKILLIVDSKFFNAKYSK